MTTFICKHCDSKRKNNNSLINHERLCKENPDRQYTKFADTEWQQTFAKGNQYTKALETGMKVIISDDTLKKLSKARLGKKHKQETKDKISKARVKYLTENPTKVPYLLNHYSKGMSYPEKYWKGIFDNHNIDYIQEHRIHTYSLDFAIVDKQINIEIDGEQHYLDERIVKSDIKRTAYLKNLGWQTIRIRWADYKKMNKDSRISYVNNILSQL